MFLFSLFPVAELKLVSLFCFSLLQLTNTFLLLFYTSTHHVFTHILYCSPFYCILWCFLVYFLLFLCVIGEALFSFFSKFSTHFSFKLPTTLRLFVRWQVDLRVDGPRWRMTDAGFRRSEQKSRPCCTLIIAGCDVITDADLYEWFRLIKTSVHGVLPLTTERVFGTYCTFYSV